MLRKNFQNVFHSEPASSIRWSYCVFKLQLMLAHVKTWICSRKFLNWRHIKGKKTIFIRPVLAFSCVLLLLYIEFLLKSSLNVIGWRFTHTINHFNCFHHYLSLKFYFIEQHMVITQRVVTFDCYLTRFPRVKRSFLENDFCLAWSSAQPKKSSNWACSRKLLVHKILLFLRTVDPYRKILTKVRFGHSQMTLTQAI